MTPAYQDVALQTFVDLCQQPVAAYLNRFEFKSPLLKSMYAVTDGFSGLNGSWQTPGTGMNFLMHNMVSYPARGLYHPGFRIMHCLHDSYAADKQADHYGSSDHDCNVQNMACSLGEYC